MASLGSGNSHNTGGGGGARNFFGSFSSASNNSSTNDNKHHHRGTQKGTIKDKDKDKDSDNEAAAAATTTPIHAASSSIASLPPSDHPRSSLQRSRSERRRRRAATSSSSTSAHFASFTSAAAATSSSSRHAAGVSSGARDHRDPRGSAPRSSLRRHRHPNDRNRVGTSLRFRQVDLDWTPDDDDDDDDGGHRVVDRRGEVEVVSSRTFSWPGRAGRDFHGGLLGGGEGEGGGVAVPDDADARYDDNNNNDNDDDTDGDGTGMDIEVMDLRPAAHPSAMMMAVTSSFVSMSSRVSIESDDLNGLFRVAIATDDRHDDDGNGNGNGNGNSDPLEERPEHWVTASEIVDEENSPSVVVDVPSAMMIAAGGGATSPSVPREERPGQASIRSGSRTRRRLFGNVPPLFSNLSSTLSSLRHHHQRQRQQQRQTPDHHSLTHRTHSSIGSMDGSGSEIWTGASHSLRSSNSTIDSHPSVPSYHGRGVPGMAGARGGVAGTTEDEDEDGSDTSSWAVIDLLGRRKWYAARIVKVAFGVVALAALMGSVLYLVLEEEEVGGGDGWVGPSLFSRSSSKNALFGDWFVRVEDEGMDSGGTGGGGGGGGNGARAMMNGDALMLPHDEGYERDARHEDLRLARRRERERWRKEERMKGRREEHIASQQRGVVHP